MNRVITHILVLTIFCSSCNLIESESPAVVTTVKSEVSLDLFNPLLNQSQFGFKLATLDESCLDNTLVAHYLWTPKALKLVVNGIIGPVECTSGYDHLNKEIAINNLSQGTYEFTVQVGESLENNGTLTFDGSTYHLSLPGADGVTVGHASMHVIPQFTFWGEVSGSGNAAEALASLEEELSAVSHKPSLNSGYYGHFEVDENAEVHLLDVEQSIQAQQSFLYHLDGGVAELKEALNSVRATYGTDITISCTLWTGASI